MRQTALDRSEFGLMTAPLLAPANLDARRARVPSAPGCLRHGVPRLGARVRLGMAPRFAAWES
jgi:hypothetical protein